MYDYDILDLNFHKKMSREDLFRYKITNSCHAMVLRGVDVRNEVVEKKRRKDLRTETITKEEKNTIIKWKVENSWGRADHHIMTHNWFLKNATCIVVKKKYLDESDLKLYEKMCKDKDYIDLHYSEFY